MGAFVDEIEEVSFLLLALDSLIWRLRLLGGSFLLGLNGQEICRECSSSCILFVVVLPFFAGILFWFQSVLSLHRSGRCWEKCMVQGHIAFSDKNGRTVGVHGDVYGLV